MKAWGTPAGTMTKSPAPSSCSSSLMRYWIWPSSTHIDSETGCVWIGVHLPSTMSTSHRETSSLALLSFHVEDATAEEPSLLALACPSDHRRERRPFSHVKLRSFMRLESCNKIRIS